MSPNAGDPHDGASMPDNEATQDSGARPSNDVYFDASCARPRNVLARTLCTLARCARSHEGKRQQQRCHY